MKELKTISIIVRIACTMIEMTLGSLVGAIITYATKSAFTIWISIGLFVVSFIIAFVAMYKYYALEAQLEEMRAISEQLDKG